MKSNLPPIFFSKHLEKKKNKIQLGFKIKIQILHRSQGMVVFIEV